MTITKLSLCGTSNLWRQIWKRFTEGNKIRLKIYDYGPVPFPSFIPAPTPLAFWLWVFGTKSESGCGSHRQPTKWNTTLRTRYVISSLPCFCLSRCVLVGDQLLFLHLLRYRHGPLYGNGERHENMPKHWTVEHKNSNKNVALRTRCDKM